MHHLHQAHRCDAFLRHPGVEGAELFFQLGGVLVRTADGEKAVGQAADHPLGGAVVVLFPLVGHKADQLAHHLRAVLSAEGGGPIQRHQRQRGAAVVVGPLVHFGAEFRLKIAAVEHPGQKVVVHVLAAEFTLPRGHTVLRQAAARQRSRHLQLPDLAFGQNLAAQHAVHLPVAQLVVHHQAVVLPVADICLVQLGQVHRLEGRLCLLHKLPQVLLGPFILHAFFSPSSRCPVSPFRAVLRCRLSKQQPLYRHNYSTRRRRIPAKRTNFQNIFFIFVKLSKPVPVFGWVMHDNTPPPRCGSGQPAPRRQNRRRRARSSCRPACRGCSGGPRPPGPANRPWG